MKETSKSWKVFEFVKYSALALMPVLDIYWGITISGKSLINLGMTALLLLAVIEIILKRGRFEINGKFLMIMLFLIAISIVDGLLQMYEINLRRTLNNTVYTLVFTIIGTYYIRNDIVEKERFFKFLCAVGIASCLFIFIQYILYLRGTVVNGFIPGLQLDRPIQYDYDVSISYGRPNSFFREPAHFSIYVLPVFTISLFRRQFFRSILFLAGIIVSTSTTGMFAALIVVGIFVAKEKKIPIILKWVLTIIGIVLVIQFIPELNQNSVLDKLKFVNLTTNIRVFGTLEYFKYFGTREVILGVGHNLLSDYLKISSPLDVDNYAAAVFFVFFSFGLVGGSVWTYYVIQLHRLSRFKIVYLIFIFVLFSDQILFSNILLYLLIVLHVFSDRTEDEAPDGAHIEEGFSDNGK